MSGFLTRHPIVSSVLAVVTIKGGPRAVTALVDGPYGFLTGAVLMLASILILRRQGWASTVGFNGPASWKQVWLAWLPFLYVGAPFINLIWSDLTTSRISAQMLAASAAQGLTVAFVEETTFRGLVLAIMLNRFHATRGQLTGSILLSGFLFGLWHVNIAIANPHWEAGVAQLVYPIFAGVGFAGVLLRTRSIWLPIAAHALLIVANVIVAGMTVDASRMATLSEVRLGAAASVLIMLPWLFYGLYLIRDMHGLPAATSRERTGDRPRVSQTAGRAS